MDTLILIIFLINNLFWMLLLYILIPVARESSDNNKKEIDLRFPFTKKKDIINNDEISPNYGEVDEVSLEEVAESFNQQFKEAEKK